MTHAGVADLLTDPPVQPTQPDPADGDPKNGDGRLLRLRTTIASRPNFVPEPLTALLSGSASPVDTGNDAGLLDAMGRPFLDGRHLINPDIAICPHCLGDVFDPHNRRYGYPFTNCNQCGPRFSIIESQPYDRAHTTMGEFAMCVECASEFLEIESRWYHAQPQACPECGPQVWYVDNAAMNNMEDWVEPALDPAVHISLQRPIDVNPDIAAAVTTLKRGGIVAVKCMGGFHLLCLATDSQTVTRLRQNKEQVHRPLAVMVRNVDEAEVYCHVSPAERALLVTPEGPVVLLRKRQELAQTSRRGLGISSEVAKNSADLGVVLPQSALAHILIQAVGAPLVITSGNRPGEPICTNNGQAWQALRHMCDGFLLHSLNVVHPCEDTVLFVWENGGPKRSTHHRITRRIIGREASTIHGIPGVQITRRSRGMVPLPVHLPKGLTLTLPVLAVGADRRNVAALAMDDQVFLTQHLGELNNPNARHMHRHTVSNFEWLFQIRPQVAVCDLHPQAISSLMANDWAEIKGQPVVRVQHHHAHIAACLADNGHTGTAIGLCFDDLGYGPDGSFWGGEVMVADLATYQRRYHLEPVHLPGGEYTDAPSWRIAVAYLRALIPSLGDEEILALLGDATPADVADIDDMRLRGQNVARTSSMARLFHAVGAILGLCHNTDNSRVIQAVRTLESQAVHAVQDVNAVQAVNAIQNGADRVYPFELRKGQIRLGGLLSALVADRLAAVALPEIAYAFFNTLASMAVVSARQVRTELLAEGEVLESHSNTVALAGEVWGGSRLLLQLAVPRLREAGFTVLLPHAVPGTDAGIAYGQVVVAAARLRDKR